MLCSRRWRGMGVPGVLSGRVPFSGASRDWGSGLFPASLRDTTRAKQALYIAAGRSALWFVPSAKTEFC